MIKVDFINTGSSIDVPKGISLKEIALKYYVPCADIPLCALVNNQLKELSFEIYNRCQIKFLDINDEQGAFVYMRTVNFILYKAVRDLYPDSSLSILNSLNKRNYCEIKGLPDGLSAHDILPDLMKRMKEIIAENIKIDRTKMLSFDAIRIFTATKEWDRVKLIDTSHKLYTSVFSIDDQQNFYFGYLTPSTGYITDFELSAYSDGFILSGPIQKSSSIVSNKLFRVFNEYMKWIDVLGVPFTGDLNQSILNGEISNIIKVSEGLQEKKIAWIADQISNRMEPCRIVLVAGPSSSGKTTFTRRTAVQLMVNGYRPLYIGMDDYFVNRENTPKDENGEYDFESIDAIDMDLFHKHLEELMSGKEVLLPKFNFKEGCRQWQDKPVKITDNDIIMIEGLHALNPIVTSNINDDYVFRIFIAPLAQLALDSQNPIDVFDNRLIRRIVRDARTRGHNALRTLQLWDKVRDGENKYIFPYQDLANVQFNSALVYELAALKKDAIIALAGVTEDKDEYAEATRLMKLLSFFEFMDDSEIPPTSILREFIGNSSFNY